MPPLEAGHKMSTRSTSCAMLRELKRDNCAVNSASGEGVAIASRRGTRSPVCAVAADLLNEAVCAHIRVLWRLAVPFGVI
jgi:hypothetical protein